jgi:hypothetical protein
MKTKKQKKPAFEVVHMRDASRPCERLWTWKPTPAILNLWELFPGGLLAAAS